MEDLGAWGTLIHEKNLKSRKSRVRLPLSANWYIFCYDSNYVFWTFTPIRRIQDYKRRMSAAVTASFLSVR
jgi:hypothetical protein